MRRLFVILLLFLVGCGTGRRIEVLRVDGLHTSHLNFLSAELTVRNRYGRPVELQGADVEITYRDRRMCRLVLSSPVTLDALSLSQVRLGADMEIYDMAAGSAFSRLYARDSVKAVSFVRMRGRAAVKIGAAQRKIRLR